jgi:hypothetical protein
MFFFVWMFVRETKGLSTEEIDQLFGGSYPTAKSPTGSAGSAKSVAKEKQVESA